MKGGCIYSRTSAHRRLVRTHVAGRFDESGRERWMHTTAIMGNRMHCRRCMTRGRILVVLALVFGGWLAAPVPGAGQSARLLEVDAVTVRGRAESGASRVDLYTRLPWSALQFLAEGNGFRAHYEVTIEVHELEDEDRAGNLVQTRVFEQRVQVDDYAQTQASTLFDRTIQSLELLPGRYLIEFQVEDRNSSRRYAQKQPVLVRDVNELPAVSDLILIDAFDEEANSITPTVSHHVGSEQDHFKLFYEIYADRSDSVRVTRDLVQLPRNSGLLFIRSLFGFGSDHDLEEIQPIYSETTVRPVWPGRNQYVVRFPIEGLRVGDYVARVSVEGGDGVLRDRAQRPVSLRWTGLDGYVRNLDDAIAQLSYIAKKREIEHILEGDTEQQRLSRFHDFWKRRDPTPNTTRNERMEEYYYRISYANREYGDFGDGWKTDRGQIMVLFGEPDLVDRHPFNFNVKPYEVWYYYQIGRRFVFVDQTGLGDFELLVPYWDERTRLR